MTSKEALECLQPFRWDDKKEIEAYEVLRELVERDTPKNLVLKAGSFFSVNIICPSCDFPINTERPELHSSIMFCERCGQKINLAQRI